MKTTGCELESQIVQALATNGISDSARQHLLGCEGCRNAVAADAWMKEYARQPVEMLRLPDPSLIWLKAQLMSQGKELERATSSFSVVQSLGFAVLAIAWAVLLSWKWKDLSSLLDSLQPGEFIFAIYHSPVLTLPFLTTAVLLLCATVAFAAHSVLAEE
jgi:hypothetical protein